MPNNGFCAEREELCSERNRKSDADNLRPLRRLSRICDRQALRVDIADYERRWRVNRAKRQ